jgi:hypothetical protein
MLRCWKNSQYSTMRGDDLLPRIQQLHDESPFALWRSGDFSSATDTLSKRVSMLASLGLPAAVGETVRYSLLPGKITYPAVAVGEGKGRQVVRSELVLDQRNGQLMGHVLSFPLLCVINLATYRLAQRLYLDAADWSTYDLEHRQQEMLVAQEQVIINGDDIIFKASEEFSSCFDEAARRMGFTLSPGKDYLSAVMCQMNSQLFRTSGPVVVREGYLSQKLILGTNIKDGGEKSCMTPVALGAEISRLSQFCPEYRNTIALSLSRFPEPEGRLRPNWFLPAHLGGLGFPSGLPVKVTRQQRIFAAQCVNEPSTTLFRLRREGLYHESPLEIPRVSVVLSRDPYVPELWEQEMTSNLESRLLMMERWRQFAPSVYLPCPPVVMENRAVRVRLNSRYSPMCDESLEAYSSARYRRSSRGLGSFVPPLGALPARVDLSSRLDAKQRISALVAPYNGVCACN